MLDNRSLKRGFSLPEVAAAMAILLVLSAVISLAVARSLTAQGVVRDERAASSVLNALVTEAAAGSYDTLISGDFKRPQACADNADLSCARVGSREVRVGWDVVLGEDLAGGSRTTASSLTLRASMEVPGRREPLLSAREVAAPFPGYAPGAGVVRVDVTGESYSGALYLMTTEESPRVLASRKVEPGQPLLMRARAEDCPEAAPCRLALTPTGGTRVEDLSLSAGSVVGQGSGVVLSTGTLVDTAVSLRRDGSLVLDLQARSDGDGVDGEPVPGSVCLWATFADAGSERLVPLCNTTTGGRIYASSYSVNGQDLALPLGVPITLSTDRPDRTCPQVPGMVGHRASGWGGAAVCTSWTWGQPTTIETESGVVPFEGARVVLSADGATQARVVWSGDGARPAAGYASQPRWSKPRQVPACAADANCQSLGDQAPERTTCPGRHCLSVAGFAPVVSSPLRGSDRVSVVRVPGSGSFTVGVRDDDGGSFTVTLAKAPESGISANGQGVSSGAALGTFTASGEISFSHASTSALESMVLRLDDGTQVRDVEIGLARAEGPWSVRGTTEVVTQGASVTARVRVVDTSGEPLAGSQVALTLPSGVRVKNTSVRTDARGVAEVDLDVSTAPRGAVQVGLRSGTRTGNVTLLVRPAAGSVDLTVTRDALTASVRDRAGGPLSGSEVRFVVLQDALPSSKVYPATVGCVTGADGRCAVALVTERDAPDGSYSAVASTGAHSDEIAFEVTR